MATKSQEGNLLICGQVYDPEDMTFREERHVRDTIKELTGEDHIIEDDLHLGDLFVATAYVLRRRDDPEFTIDQALDLKRSEIVVGADTKKAPPTRRGSSVNKTPAISGSQK